MQTENENKIPKKFDPTSFIADSGGKQYKVSELSREDLMQLVCESMVAMDKIEAFHNGIGKTIDAWRFGKIAPLNTPEEEVSSLVKNAIVEFDAYDDFNTNFHRAAREKLVSALDHLAAGQKDSVKHPENS